MSDKMSVEEQLELLAEYFSDEAIDSLTEHLPQETFEELLQVVALIDKRIKRLQVPSKS